MADLDTKAGDEPPLNPDEVADRTFATAFRGFDPVQVRAFLGTVADELRRLQDREGDLRRSIEEASPATVADAAGAGEGEAAGGPSADHAVDEAYSVVVTARAEADLLVREAKDRVAVLGAAATAETTRVLDEARAEAARIRAHATDDLKGRAEEAEATAVRKIAEAELEAAAIRVRAREESEATIEAARERGREMVSEAQAARERMLADLAKRKRAAQSQLEQLRAGRDRLLETLKVARRSIDEMTTRFDAGDGGPTSLHPPASGTPAGPVTTTPGASSTEARPRVAASSTEAPPRPVRTRAVAIGEAPADQVRPLIAAPQARGGADADDPVRSKPPGGEPERPDHRPSIPTQAPTEERRSSSLRILRRNKPQAALPALPPLIGRDSQSEGVRIIGPPPSDGPDPENDARTGFAPDDHGNDHQTTEATEGVTGSTADETPADQTPADEINASFEELVAESPAPAPVDDSPAELVSEAPMPAPLLQEEIRPRIEDLFARIRADREATTASARQVLGIDQGGEAVATTATSGEIVEPAGQVATAVDTLTDADENLLQARDAVIDPLSAQLTKRLKRALQDEQNASLDRLRTSRGSARVEQILSRPDDQAAPYRFASVPFLDQAARAGAATSSFGVIAVPVDDLATQLADDLAGGLRNRIDQMLSAGPADEVDLSTLSERISAVYREWKAQKVGRLAVHYLIAAHERGGFLAQPEGTALRWVVDDDGTCPDCEDNALAGETPRGHSFPTGQLHPPAHLGCRCLLSSTPT